MKQGDSIRVTKATDFTKRYHLMGKRGVITQVTYHVDIEGSTYVLYPCELSLDEQANTKESTPG
jgi:hypothetical protein